MSKKFLSPIKLAQGATNPAAGSEGELFWNTTDLKVYIHNGTAWTPSAGGFTISDTAPTSPAPRHGDSWLDSSEGCLYAFYDDGLADSRTNLIGNPGFEVDTTGWSSTDFLDRDLGGAWGKYDGIASLFFTTDVQYQKVTVQPSSPYTLSVYGMTDYGSTALTLQTIFYDSSNTIISTASSTGLSFPSYGTWERKSFTATSPANAAYAKIGLIHEAANIDNVLFEQSASLGTYIVGTVAGTGPTGQWIQIQTTSAINSELANRMAAAESDVTTLQAQVSGFEADVISLDSRTDSLEARATAVESRATVLEARNMSYNYIINGAFDIWQRGTSSTSAGYATADRWYGGTSAATTTFSQEAVTVPSGFRYAIKLSQQTTASTLSVSQVIETSNAALLAGKTVTLSSYSMSSESIQARNRLYYSTNVDNARTNGWTEIAATGTNVYSTTSSNFTRGSATFAIPSTAKTLLVIVQSNVQVSVGGSIHFTGVQLEEGSEATPFRRNAPSIQAELEACQRYYQRFSALTSNDGYLTVGQGQAQSSTVAHFLIPLFCEMRKPITMSYSAVGDWGAHRPGQTITQATSLTIPTTAGSISSNRMVWAYMVFGSDGNYGSNVPCFLSARGTSTSWLALEAEL